MGGKWEPTTKTWEIHDGQYDDVRYNAMEMGLSVGIHVGSKQEQSQPLKSQPLTQAPPQFQDRAQGRVPPKQGTIWLGRSKDGRFLIMRINLVAFAGDVQAVLSGQKKGASSG